MRINPILNTDSYKYSHSLQYPQGTEYVYSYIESRGGDILNTVLFGLQYFLQEYLAKPFTKNDIDEAEEIIRAHGEPFNREGFEYILQEYRGYWPVKIRAVPEGTVMPTHNLLLDIINNDKRVPWVTSFLETQLLRAVWYGTTVASREFEIKKMIREYLKKTAEPESLQWIGVKHNDFGARGASSYETAVIGGLAHLAIFTGTDNVPALLGARQYYKMKDVAGFSIPAAEHSTMTSWGGRDGEPLAMKNMLIQFARPGKFLAVVSDSYDIYNAVENYWCGSLLKDVKDSGAVVVIRPDSGNPTMVPVELMKLIASKTGDCQKNHQGYWMLPPYFRIIQGDGMNLEHIRELLANIEAAGFSTDNLAIGMGGGMLQRLDRDTMKFAMKCSAIRVNGLWRDVFKDPITDSGKVSKKGRMELVNDRGEYKTIPYPMKWQDYAYVVPRVVYDNKPCNQYYESLAQIRERVDASL